MLRPFHTLVVNKFYVDELYHLTVVTGLKITAAVSWFLVDRLAIDAVAVEGTGRVVRRASGLLSRLNTGSIAAGVGLIVVGAALVLRFGT